jgi:hypothetical protein
VTVLNGKLPGIAPASEAGGPEKNEAVC